MKEKAVKTEVRTCDDQWAMPKVFGATKKDPCYPFLTVTDITVISAKDYMPLCGEVSKSHAS
jgi:hypothetical protein